MKKGFIGMVVFALYMWAQNMRAQDYAITPEMPGVFTQYALNPVLLNPAYTGLSGKYRLFFNYRSQWAGHDGAPQAFSLAYHGPAYSKIGIGGLMHVETFGKSQRFRGQLSYAYRFRAGELDFSLGLMTGYIRYSLSPSVLTDPSMDRDDPTVFDAVNGVEYFASSIGMVASYSNRLIFGLTFPSVINTRLGGTAINQGTENRFNFIANLSMPFKIQGYQLEVEPSIYIKKLGDIPLHVDLNVIASFLDDKLFGGVLSSIGAPNSLGFLLGVNVSNFYFFYSYDVSFREFQQYNNGSHEITLAFNLFENILKKQ